MTANFRSFSGTEGPADRCSAHTTRQPDDPGPMVTRMGDVFVDLADTLASTFDYLDAMHDLTAYAVELLPPSASGVMVADDEGRLTAMASTHESSRQLQLFELESEQGPGLDCFHSQRPVANVDRAEAAGRWPKLTSALTDAGFHSAHAIPLRLRHETIGVLNLYSLTGEHLTKWDVRLACSLATMATIGILHERVGQAKDLLAVQLQSALNSRVVIEQAKGIIAERNSIDIDSAFKGLRRYARGLESSVTVAAANVIDGTWEGML
jgi:GAF domain-containing protein